ncbi:MAG: PAS domain-containing protein, partial [Spirochaetia bacterium]
MMQDGRTADIKKTAEILREKLEATGNPSASKTADTLEKASSPEEAAEALADIVEQKAETEAALLERNKELVCLRRITNEMLEQRSIEELCHTIIEALEEGMQYPESAAVVVAIDNLLFHGPRFDSSLTNSIEAPVHTAARETGRVAVYYTGDEVFLADEHALIKQVAKMLSSWLEKKHSRDAIRRSEENLAVTLQSMGDAVIATDSGGDITMMNPVAEQLTGWNFEEAEGKPLAEAFHIIYSAGRQVCPNPVKEVLKKRQPVGLEDHTSLIAKDGSEYQIADSAAPIFDADGEITGVVLVFHDVTEKYWRQKEIEKNR